MRASTCALVALCALGCTAAVPLELGNGAGKEDGYGSISLDLAPGEKIWFNWRCEEVIEQRFVEHLGGTCDTTVSVVLDEREIEPPAGEDVRVGWVSYRQALPESEQAMEFPVVLKWNADENWFDGRNVIEIVGALPISDHEMTFHYDTSVLGSVGVWVWAEWE